MIDLILVDLSDHYLTAYRNNVPVFESRVITGRAGHRTPELSSVMTRIVINPAWYVPNSIADRRGWKRGTIVPPEDPTNPLGEYKFVLENTNGIILHHTNNPTDFDVLNAPLEFSSGCVRVERSEELAELILKKTLENGESFYNTTFTIDPIPVIIQK